MDAVLATHVEASAEAQLTFAEPEGLSDLGRAAYRKIVDVLADAGALWSGGCRVFYSPHEWCERGEQYGVQSELIVVYDGGSHRRFFNDDGFGSTDCDRMARSLAEVGVYYEPCTGWHCAIYPD